MLHPSEALARYRIQGLLSEAEHARLVARLRSLQRARRAAKRPAAIPASTKPAATAGTIPGMCQEHPGGPVTAERL
jgi:hypothetical protein